MNELLITGIPRSGTTLACALVDSLRDSLCLSEPLQHAQWVSDCREPSAYAALVYRHFRDIRMKLLAGEEVEVVDRRKASGEPVTDYIERCSEKVSVDYASHAISGKGLSRHFLLAIKHNANYTAVLPEILKITDLRVMAVVRHPIDTIISWRSVDLPIRRGRLPAGEKLWPELSRVVQSGAAAMEVHVRIYELFLQRYLEHLDQIDLIRYEDIVAQPRLISDLLEREQVRSIEVAARSARASLSASESDRLRELIKKHAPSTRLVYAEDGGLRSSASNRP